METKVGPYQLGESLGTLPFGELVAATHTARRESFAVLLLDERLTKEPRFRGLLRLEISRAGGLRHPAVARPIEVGEHAGAMYVVFERPADATILTLDDAAAQTPERVVTLVQALAAALDAAHDRRLAHGVLGPSSVLVKPDGSPALVGLGLLGAVEEAGLMAVVADAADDAYTAPEQRNGPRAVASADGFALATLAASLLPAPSDGVRVVLDRQLAASPSDRFPTDAAFATALADALAPTATPDADATHPAGASDAGLPISPASPPTRPAVPTRSPLSAPTSTISPSSGTPVHERAPAPATTAALEAPTASPVPPAPSPEPATPGPTDTPQLPWEAAARTQLTADGEDVAAEPPPWTPGANTSDPAAAAEDVPAAAGPDHAITASLPWSAPPPEIAESTVVVVPATPAVLACLGRLESKDPLGDGVHWLANRIPLLQQLLDRVCVAGKVGPLPLGIATAGLLAVLLLVTNQIVPAMAVVGLVGVLYGLPLVVKKLTAGEAARHELVRVTGTARLSGRTDSMLGGQPHLGLTNHVLLSLPTHAFDSLARYAVPVQVDRPIPGTMGVRPEIIAYDLPGVTVSYIAGNRLLLDVRAPTGVILYRSPRYDGEPDDGPMAPDDGIAPVHAVTSAAADISFSQPAAFQPTTPDQPSSGMRHAARASRHPMTPRLINALTAARTTALRQVALVAAVPVVLSIIFTIGGFGFFTFFTLFAGVVIILVGPGGRAMSLWNIRDAIVFAQATGPISLTRSKQGKSQKYQLRLFDSADMEITQTIYERLRHEGQRVGGGSEFSFEAMFRMNPVLDEYTLPSVTTSYLPSNLLLLEVVSPFGVVLYRDPALAEGDLPHPPRTI